MRQTMIRSAGALATLMLFLVAAVLGTTGLSSASVTRGAVVVSASSPGPMELTACDQNTCQVIANSGTMVTDWATSTTAPNSVCTYAEYIENGTIIAERARRRVCQPDRKATPTRLIPANSPANTKLCTVWTGIAGKPCNTV